MVLCAACKGYSSFTPNIVLSGPANRCQLRDSASRVPWLTAMVAQRSVATEGRLTCLMCPWLRPQTLSITGIYMPVLTTGCTCRLSNRAKEFWKVVESNFRIYLPSPFHSLQQLQTWCGRDHRDLPVNYADGFLMSVLVTTVVEWSYPPSSSSILVRIRHPAYLRSQGREGPSPLSSLALDYPAA